MVEPSLVATSNFFGPLHLYWMSFSHPHGLKLYHSIQIWSQSGICRGYSKTPIFLVLFVLLFCLQVCIVLLSNHSEWEPKVMTWWFDILPKFYILSKRAEIMLPACFFCLFFYCYDLIWMAVCGLSLKAIVTQCAPSIEWNIFQNVLGWCRFFIKF